MKLPGFERIFGDREADLRRVEEDTRAASVTLNNAVRQRHQKTAEIMSDMRRIREQSKYERDRIMRHWDD